ncbi:E6 [Tick-associated papillomavirus lsx]|nr:E6 [Tick-associated papillomavirus lsx]
METSGANGDQERRRAKPCILCIGCGTKLTLNDRRNCWRKGIRTIKKSVNSHRWSFSTCKSCSFSLAAEEAVAAAGTEIFLEADGVQIFEGKDLSAIDVRCNFCLGLLSILEKEELEKKHIPFLQRRGIWRGVCFDCSNAGEI